LPGTSLRPLLGAEKAPWREYLCCEWNVSHCHPVGILCPQRTIRDSRYKLIVNLLAGTPNPAEHYYTQQVIVQTGATQAEIDAAPPAIQATYRTWRAAPPVELYDLERDPNEFENVAGRVELAEVESRLLKELAAWREATQDPLLDAQKLKLLVEEHARQADKMAGGLVREKLEWEYVKYLYAN
jgi:N-sulfoglucosamine sulfohydrolase